MEDEVYVDFVPVEWPNKNDPRGKSAWRLCINVDEEKWSSAVGFGTKRDAEMVLDIMRKNGRLHEWLTMPPNAAGEYDELDKWMIEQLRW